MGDPSEAAPGWDAIDGALAPLYDGVEPKHYGTVMSRQDGGSDPIHGISVYLRDAPVPHFHFVTYGFTELWEKESEDAEISGFGFELTFRLAREPTEEEPPAWALHLLQNLGRYVFRTGNAFAAGHKMGLNGPIALGERTAITAVCFAADPELGAFHSSNGQAEFLQVVGITEDEYRLIQDWCTDGLLELLAARSPMLITELWRPSILDLPGVAEALQERIDREGSSETSSFAGDLSYDSDGSRVVMTLGALYAPAIRRAMLGRIRHRRRYQLMGRTQGVIFEPGEAAWSIADGNLVLGVPPGLARQLAAQVGSRAGRYDLAIPGVTLVVAPTYIRDQSGRVIDVKGVDEDEIEELAAAENAKLEQRAAKPDEAAAKPARRAEAATKVAGRGEASPAKRVLAALAAKRAEEPAVEEAGAKQPAAAKKPSKQPAAAEASAKQRPAAVKQAAAARAGARKPAAAKGEPKKSVAARAGARKPAGAKKPVAARAGAKKPAAARVEPKKPAGAKASAKKPAAAKGEAKKPAGAKASAKKPTAAKKPSVASPRATAAKRR